MFKKTFFVFAILWIGFFSCESTGVHTGENAEWSLFLPERFEEISSGKTKATFKTDKPKAAVYINNHFQGLTPLEINDLIPGDYFATIKREGYKTVQVAIQIKDGISDYYYLEMEVEADTETDSSEQEEPQEENPDTGLLKKEDSEHSEFIELYPES